MKNLIVTLSLLLFTNLTVMADCVTGYACSLKELQKQEQEYRVQNEKATLQKNTQSQKHISKQKNKNDGVFVDGKEKNSPKYTEMFTLKGIIP